MDQHVKDIILKATCSKSVISKKAIQSLWSGYGEIFRCQLAGGKYDQIVVKHVKLPKGHRHPRGWNTDISHQRKLRSYLVEMHWYKELAKRADDSCKIPKMIHCWQQEGEMLMVMEDLNASGYPERKSAVNLTEIKNCLTWLANFHGTYMMQKPNGLWEIGSYWHLDTRPEELQVMQDLELQHAAQAIDNILNGAKYQTIIHGDAKLANFCFSKDASQVAAVDFQYVGGGCGMKDVAYFFSSCLLEKDCEQYEEELLNHYFGVLKNSLNNSPLPINTQEVIREWTVLYKYAWADFYRFLDGWSPGHWKMHEYSKKMKVEVLKELSIV